MATLTWTGASAPDNRWFVAGNWTPQVVPVPGDTLIVSSGTQQIDGGTVIGEQIQIAFGNSSPASIPLQANGVAFKPEVDTNTGEVVYEQSLTVTGGSGTSVNATLLGGKNINTGQDTTYEGQIIVATFNGTLTIDAGTNGNFTFLNTTPHNTFVLVTQESALHFEG